MQNAISLEQIKASAEPVLLYFGATGCGVCQAVAPRLQALAAEHRIKLVQIDIALDQLTAGQLQVFTVPTVLLLAAGRELLRESRFIDFSRLGHLLSLLHED